MTLVEALSRLLPGEEPFASELLEQSMRHLGIDAARRRQGDRGRAQR